MRLKLHFSSIRPYIDLPIHYNEIVQAVLYYNLPRPLSTFLHDYGFFHNKRPFKLFTFSKLFSERFTVKRQQKRIVFQTPVVLYLSSAIPEITKSFGEIILRKEYVQFERNTTVLESIEIIGRPRIESDQIRIRTLSPITVYRTFDRDDGRKFYRYYNPVEEEFHQLLKENIRKKYEIISGKSIDKLQFDLQPLKFWKKLLKYKGIVIEAYDGKFLLNTDPEVFQTVYDAGIGAKNSQGFGMIEIL